MNLSESPLELIEMEELSLVMTRCVDKYIVYLFYRLGIGSENLYMAMGDYWEYRNSSIGESSKGRELFRC